MLNMDINTYKKISQDQAISLYGWGYGLSDDGSPVYVSETPENKIFIAIEEGGDWCCEIEGFEYCEYDERSYWNMIGQGFGETPEQALLYAVCDCVGINEVKCEACCEDAVNVLTYSAYMRAYDKSLIGEPYSENIDNLFRAAREYVKDYVRFCAFDWEEF